MRDVIYWWSSIELIEEKVSALSSKFEEEWTESFLQCQRKVFRNSIVKKLAVTKGEAEKSCFFFAKFFFAQKFLILSLFYPSFIDALWEYFPNKFLTYHTFTQKKARLVTGTHLHTYTLNLFLFLSLYLSLSLPESISPTFYKQLLPAQIPKAQ